MKLDNRLLIEIVGVSAVVASLIFVGLQLMLDRRVAVGEMYSTRAQGVQDKIHASLQSEAYMTTLSRQWEDGRRPHWWDYDDPIHGKTATARDVEVLRLENRALMVGYDNFYFQYQQGLMTGEQWAGRREVLKQLMRERPALRAFLTDPSTNQYLLLDLALELAREIDEQ